MGFGCNDFAILKQVQYDVKVPSPGERVRERGQTKDTKLLRY